MRSSLPRCFCFFSCGCAFSAKISNQIELHYTYIHGQHCISVSNQHGANLEAGLSSFFFVQKQLGYSQRHDAVHSLPVLESFPQTDVPVYTFAHPQRKRPIFSLVKDNRNVFQTVVDIVFWRNPRDNRLIVCQ